MLPVDKSILNSKRSQSVSYLDDLAFAVCISSESLEKYKKIVEKQYGNDVYVYMDQFSKALQQQVKHMQFTSTSLLNLKYIGKNAGMSENAIDMIIDYFNSKIKKEQLYQEEDEYWNKCHYNDKEALLGYLLKHPQGRYVKDAQAKINTIDKQENTKREDTAFWKQCSPNNKLQLKKYLQKYPKGVYATRAISLIADLERMEKKAVEESRVFNQCHTPRDYMTYLGKYPNGVYSAKAKAIIADFERKEAEESRIYNLCKNKRDYLDYVKRYPNGRYINDAQKKTEILKNSEGGLNKETTYWNRCAPNDKSSLQEYLRKYPNGIYSTKAKAIIADLERIEKYLLEESRIYKQCNSKTDYMDYLQKYPKGRYVSLAYKQIAKLKKSENSSKVTIVTLFAAIVFFVIGLLLRDNYNNLGGVLFLLSTVCFSSFSISVTKNVYLSYSINSFGLFVLSLSWADVSWWAAFLIALAWSLIVQITLRFHFFIKYIL